MTTSTRTFTVAELDEIGVPYDLPDSIAISDTHVSSGRWTETRRCLFRHDGRVWAVTYERGLTEHQEADLFRGDTVTATEMEQREVTVLRWMPAEDPARTATTGA